MHASPPLCTSQPITHQVHGCKGKSICIGLGVLLCKSKRPKVDRQAANQGLSRSWTLQPAGGFLLAQQVQYKTRQHDTARSDRVQACHPGGWGRGKRIAMLRSGTQRLVHDAMHAEPFPALLNVAACVRLLVLRCPTPQQMRGYVLHNTTSKYPPQTVLN